MKTEGLKKPLPFKWRVQSVNQWGATCVAYIDARQVQDTLDEEVGADNWQCRFSEHKGNLFCEVGIRTPDGWVWKSDCGSESNIEKEKGEASDAFKRAAVMWGIGRFLYSMDVVKLPVKEKNGKYYPYSENKNKFVTAAEINEWCNTLIKK
jgi:hypothetical protein